MTTRTAIVRVHQFSDARLTDVERQLLKTKLAGRFQLDDGQGNGFAVVPSFAGEISGTSSRIDNGRLHAALSGLAVPSPRPSFFVHLLVAKSYDTRPLATYGVMFDVGNQNAAQREGCAVFIDAMVQFSFTRSSELFRSMLLRTMAHELGHTFNLCHTSIPNEVMVSDPISQEDFLDDVLFSGGSVSHLCRHSRDAVRPGSSVRYGDRQLCQDPHTHDTDCAIGSVGRPRSPRKVRVDLTVHAGGVYPETAEPTLVIGEPLYVTVRLINDSSRAVYFPAYCATSHQSLQIFRLEGDRATNLLPPVMACDFKDQRGWCRLPAGREATFCEALLYRGGALVFPREGRYRLIARVRVRNRWITSEERVVHVAPPLKGRHERSCEVAAGAGVGLFVELGGALHLASAHDRLRGLLRSNPDFPLNDLVRLRLGQAAVLRRRGTDRRWRTWLDRVSRKTALPPFVRREADRFQRLDEVVMGRSTAHPELTRDLGPPLGSQVLPAPSAEWIRQAIDDLAPPPEQEGEDE